MFHPFTIARTEYNMLQPCTVSRAYGQHPNAVSCSFPFETSIKTPIRRLYSVSEPPLDLMILSGA
jgi:hypothetical protein